MDSMKAPMALALRLFLVVLLVPVREGVAFRMGQTSVKTFLACHGRVDGPIECSSSEAVLILNASYGFKYSGGCASGYTSTSSCCEQENLDCLVPYSDTHVDDLQKACQDKPRCDITPTHGPERCGRNKYNTYSLVRYICVKDTADNMKEQTTQGTTVYVELAGEDEQTGQQSDENITCLVQSVSQDKTAWGISFITPNLPGGAKSTVRIGEETHTLQKRLEFISVTSPEVLAVVSSETSQGSLWAVIHGDESLLNVTCTRNGSVAPAGMSHLVGAVVGGVTAGLVGLSVVAIVTAWFCSVRRKSSSFYGPGNTPSNVSDPPSSKTNEYAVVELQTHADHSLVEHADGKEEENYDKLGLFKTQNNNRAQPNLYGHIQVAATGSTENDYDHVR